MSTGLVISIVVSLISMVLCAGIAFFFFCLVLGIILLRRRGKKNVTAKEAVATGVETVSMVFRRNAEGDLEAVAAKDLDEDDDDDDEDEAPASPPPPPAPKADAPPSPPPPPAPKAADDVDDGKQDF